MSRAAAASANLGMPATKRTWKSDDGSVEIYSSELPPCDALDLLAEISGIITPAAGAVHAWKTGSGGLGASLQMLTEQLTGGRLTSYLPRLLAGTTLLARGEGAGNYGMASRDAINKAFIGRAKLMAPAVQLAMEVNFKSFLDGMKLIGIDLKTPTTSQSTSEDSDLSTSDIG